MLKIQKVSHRNMFQVNWLFFLNMSSVDIFCVCAVVNSCFKQRHPPAHSIYKFSSPSSPNFTTKPNRNKDFPLSFGQIFARIPSVLTYNWETNRSDLMHETRTITRFGRAYKRLSLDSLFLTRFLWRLSFITTETLRALFKKMAVGVGFLFYGCKETFRRLCLRVRKLTYVCYWDERWTQSDDC